MKLSVIILAFCVLMGSTSGDCPNSVNCLDGELTVRPANIDVPSYHHSYKFLNDFSLILFQKRKMLMKHDLLPEKALTINCKSTLPGLTSSVCYIAMVSLYSKVMARMWQMLWLHIANHNNIA